MTAKEQRRAAENFAARWLGRGYEKGECQKFWRGLLHDVFGVADPDDWVQYEVPVATGYVDAYISRTKVLIEQKGFGHGLADKAAMKQAMMYVGAMPDTMPVRYVVLSNFQEFWIYDKHAPEMKPVKVVLRDLPRKLGLLSFLAELQRPVPVVRDVAAVDRRAGELVGRLYSALLRSYVGEVDDRTLEEGGHFDYILGNPPFIGARNKSPEQAADIDAVFAGWRNTGNLDYVTCWYRKAADLMRGTSARCALVSTNSVCQGESAALLWKPLFAQGVEIDFAWRTFVWDSEANEKAHVHVVIVGFHVNSDEGGRKVRGSANVRRKALYEDDGTVTSACHINGYLMDGPDMFVENIGRPLCRVPCMGIENFPLGNYLLVPKVSSQRRRYIPMGFLGPETFSSDLVMVVPDASLYHFGVLTSSVHMAWMRTVAGRLKSDYRYSAAIVYNNFPWPRGVDGTSCGSEAGRESFLIERTARAILDARALYPDSTMADLYDDTFMPPELRKAHEANDAAVLAAYGFSTRATEGEIVAKLFEMYAELTGSGAGQERS